MDKPLVSVIIPAYNSAESIGGTLESVVAQGYGNIEAVVVDDGSVDCTEKVVERFAATGKVAYHRQGNSGPGAARNLGIRVSRGEYVAFLDADDSLTPGSIEYRMALLDEVKGLELVFSNYLIKWPDASAEPRFDGNYPPTGDYSSLRCAHGTVLDGSPRDIFEIPFDFWTGAVLAGRKLLERAGPFRTDIRIGEDRDMWIRLALNAGKIGYVAAPVAEYNRTEGGLTGRDSVGYSEARRDLNRRFLEQYSAAIGKRKVRKVIQEKLSWIYFDLGIHYRENGMFGCATGNFLKSIYYHPGNGLPYKEIANMVLPARVRNLIKRAVDRHG
jgi:glycosyltransferase involved in cell wall biosynthesis